MRTFNHQHPTSREIPNPKPHQSKARMQILAQPPFLLRLVRLPNLALGSSLDVGCRWLEVEFPEGLRHVMGCRYCAYAGVPAPCSWLQFQSLSMCFPIRHVALVVPGFGAREHPAGLPALPTRSRESKLANK